MIGAKLAIWGILAAPLMLSTVPSPWPESGLVRPYKAAVCGYCNYCAIPVEYSHEFNGNPFGNSVGGTEYHGCFIGPCDHMEAGCGFAAYGGEDVEASQLATEIGGAISAAQNGDLAPLAGLLGHYPHRASINQERSALQVTGCKRGFVAVHIPLNRDQIARLSE